MLRMNEGPAAMLVDELRNIQDEVKMNKKNENEDKDGKTCSAWLMDQLWGASKSFRTIYNKMSGKVVHPTNKAWDRVR